MSVDAKCYDAISGAGLEPILSPNYTGGRGQASGFIMRMMAENKKKHQGQYKNPSDNDYGSTMNKFRAFDYKRLANAEQNGNNQSDIGASPFIQRHFGSPEAVPFIPKAQRGSEEHRVIEGETEEQKAARLQAKAEELAQLAKDLLEKSAATKKVKGFLKGKVLVKKAKELLQKKKTEKQKEDERKAKELSKEQLIKEAIANAKVLLEEWDKDENAIYDYLEYKYPKSDYYSRKSQLGDLWQKWCKEKQLEKFGDALKPIITGYYYGREEVKNKIIPRPDTYYRPRRGHSYKKLSYAEAKKVYDKYFPPEEETEEEKAQRTRGLKGVVRRLVRTKKSEKELVASAPTPKFWNGYMCVEDFAKHHKYSNMGTLIQNKKWFGEWTYSMGHEPLSKWTIAPEDEAAIKDAPAKTAAEKKKYKADMKKIDDEFEPRMKEAQDKKTGKYWDILKEKNKATQKLQEEYNADANAVAEQRDALYKSAKNAIVKITTTYYQWVFKKALPMFGWKLIEYHPRAEDFPMEPTFKTINKGTDGAPKFYYERTGEYPSSLLMSITGTESPRYNYDMKRPLPDMKPIPADMKLVLLVEPSGDVAWLITTTKEGNEEGGLDWTDLAQRSIGIGPNAHLGNNQGTLSFRQLFIKNGAHWRHAALHKTEGYEYRNYGAISTYAPVKLPDGREHKWESSFNSKQIQTIIEPLLRELSSRAEWNGVPLTKTDLTGAGRRKRR